MSQEQHALLIEDSASYAELIVTWLDEAFPTLAVTHVTHLHLGITLLQRRPVAWDVILLDLTLPDAHALTALPAIYEEASKHAIPIIVFSGTPQWLLPVPLHGHYTRYIEKNGEPGPLIQALTEVLSHG